MDFLGRYRRLEDLRAVLVLEGLLVCFRREENMRRLRAGGRCVPKPSAPHPAIVRLVLKATVASVEIKKPAGKWEKVSGESYAKIQPDPETGMPGGLGLGTISGLTLLMQDNKDRQMLARMGGSTK